MAVTKSAEYELPLDDLPLGWLAKSYDGHLFEIDINRYNGVAFVRYPKHVPTLRVIREVFCAMSDTCMVDDLIADCESMPYREYGGVRQLSGYTLVKDDDGIRILDAEGGVIDA